MLLATLLLTFATDPITSGVPVGKRPGPYSFLVATGSERGKQTCLICEQADKPAVVIFNRSLSDPLGKLLAGFDAEMLARSKTGFKVWMTQLTTKADLDQLAKWSQAQGLKNLPIGAFEDVDGPPSYRIHSEADVTVMIFVKEKVVANVAIRANELTDEKVKAVLAELTKLDSK